MPLTLIFALALVVVVMMTARRTTILRATATIAAVLLLLLVVLSVVFPGILGLATGECTKEAADYTMTCLVAEECTTETAGESA
jgi:amino acid permease